jgi:TRAP-type C4-dicarboxylate transport system permease small subunit
VAQLMRGLHRAENLLHGQQLASLLERGIAQNGLRKVNSNTVELADPVQRIIELWVALRGALGATRERRHIAIDALPRLLPPKLHRAAWALTQTATATICGVLAWTGWGMVGMEREAPSLFVQGVSSWIPMLVFPAGFALMGLRFLVSAFGVPPEPGHVDVHLLEDEAGQGAK